MRIDHLREFIVFSHTLNMSRAAKQLNVTQPALSNHMKALEKEVGVTLFHRNDAMAKKKSRLTQAGRSFLDDAQKLVDHYDEAIRKARSAGLLDQETLTVRLPRSELSLSLLSLLAEFSSLHRDIRIEKLSWSSTDVLEDIQSGDVDCAEFGNLLADDAIFEEEVGAELIPYGRTELYGLVSEQSCLVDDGCLSVESLSNASVVIPSNHKAETARYVIDGMLGRFGLEDRIVSKYFDSTEDYLLSPLGASEVILLSAEWLEISTLRLRTDVVVAGFSPAIRPTVYLAIRHDPSNGPLNLFREFVLERYKSAGASEGGERGCLLP